MLAYCVSFGFILVTFQGKLSQAQTLKSKRDGFNSTYPIPIMTLSTSPVGKESTCNAGDPGSIPWSGRSAGEGIGYTPVFLGFPCDSAGKQSTCNEGDLGSIPELGRSPGEGNGYPFQYSGLEKSTYYTYPWGRKRVGHNWVTFTFKFISHGLISRRIAGSYGR